MSIIDHIKRMGPNREIVMSFWRIGIMQRELHNLETENDIFLVTT